jgi:cation:H+ antiporter
MVLLQLALAAALIILLVKSSDFFVEAVAKIAKYLGVSEFVIGLTVVAIGTSLPELGSSVMGAILGESDFAIGNVLGSNIANIGLVMGFSSIVLNIKTDKEIFGRDGLIMLGVTAAFALFALDATISFFEGLTLLILIPFYLMYLFNFRPNLRKRLYDAKDYLVDFYHLKSSPQMPEKELEKDLKKEKYEDFVGEGFDLEEYKKIKPRLALYKGHIIKDIAIIVISGFMIYLSARYLVPTAVSIARHFGVTENIIGATMVALGTSLPELSVSISSLRKGFNNMLLGNIIGSNVFNLALVGGLVSMVSQVSILPSTLYLILPFTVMITVLFFVFLRTGWKIKRPEGALLLGLYGLFIYLLLAF